MALIAFALTRHSSRVDDSSTHSPLDIGGAILSTTALLLLLHASVREQDAGSTSSIATELVVAAVVLTMFVRHEQRLNRRNGAPLLPTALLASRHFTLGAALIAGFFALFTVMLFVISVTAQEELRYSALHTTVITMPFAYQHRARGHGVPQRNGAIRLAHCSRWDRRFRIFPRRVRGVFAYHRRKN